MSGKIVLLVEDNPSDVKLTMRAFQQNNILNEVVVARDGQEALDYLFAERDHAGRGSDTDPMVILLDLKLPKIDGLEVLKRIRTNDRTRRTPVVVLTSSKEESDLCESYDFGANSYVRKPVDFNQFSEVVRQLQLYWLVMNEAPPCEPMR